MVCSCILCKFVCFLTLVSTAATRIRVCKGCHTYTRAFLYWKWTADTHAEGKKIYFKFFYGLFRAREHSNLKSFIGGKGRDRPTSLYSKACGPKWPRMFEWTNNWHGVVHTMHWILYCGLLDFASTSHQRGGSKTKPGENDTLKSHYPWFISTYHLQGPMVMK